MISDRQSLVWFLLAFALGAATVAAQTAPTPKEVVLKAYRDLEARQTWTGEAIMKRDGARDFSKIVVRFVAPDRAHTVLSYQGRVVDETISIGENEYTKAGGRWQKKKIDKFDEFWKNISRLAGSFEDRFVVNVAAAGREVVGGEETSIYQFDYDIKGALRAMIEKMQLKTTPPDDFEEVKVRVWINREGLPVKIESVRRTEDFNGKIVAMRRTVTYKFNEELKIEAPALAAGAQNK